MALHLWGSKLTADVSIATEQLGIVRTEFDTVDLAWKKYRYVQMNRGGASDNTQERGEVVSYLGTRTSAYVVTPDISASAITRAAGVTVGTISNFNFGWIQVGGLCTSITTDGAVADGNIIGVHPSTDGIAQTVTADSEGAESRVLGVARAADSGSFLADCHLFCE